MQPDKAAIVNSAKYFKFLMLEGVTSGSESYVREIAKYSSEPLDGHQIED